MWLHHLANILRHAIFLLLQNKALRLLHRAKTYIMSRILPLRELRRTVARGRPFKKVGDGSMTGEPDDSGLLCNVLPCVECQSYADNPVCNEYPEVFTDLGTAHHILASKR